MHICFEILSPHYLYSKLNKMKTTFLALPIIAFITGTIPTPNGLDSNIIHVNDRENLQETQIKDLVDAKQDLKETQKGADMEYQKFRKTSEIMIKSNEKCFFDLKVNLSKINQKDKAAYQKKVSGVEQKNINLKKTLFNYKKGEGQYKWTSFKRKFNHDMDELEMLMWGLN